jgi:hypothetical protein
MTLCRCPGRLSHPLPCARPREGRSRLHSHLRRGPLRNPTWQPAPFNGAMVCERFCLSESFSLPGHFLNRPRTHVGWASAYRRPGRAQRVSPRCTPILPSNLARSSAPVCDFVRYSYDRRSARSDADNRATDRQKRHPKRHLKRHPKRHLRPCPLEAMHFRHIKSC